MCKNYACLQISMLMYLRSQYGKRKAAASVKVRVLLFIIGMYVHVCAYMYVHVGMCMLVSFVRHAFHHSSIRFEARS